MQQSVKSRVLKTEPVYWRELMFLQDNSFKEISSGARQKLKNSVISNDFSQPFYVWQDESDGVIYCLDGKHRSQVLAELAAEGSDIPDQLPATFIRCSGKKEAAELVLQYSSIYARITEEGMLQFLDTFDLQLEDVKLTVDLPDFEFPDFAGENSGEQVAAAARQSLAERFLVPPFSILDTRQGYWQTRKNQWHALIGDDGATRNSTLRRSSSGDDPSYYRQKNAAEMKLQRKLTNEEFEESYYERGTNMPVGVSLLDPVLSELIVTWFGQPGGAALDPFAGDTVFGFVAASKGQNFTGIELRQEQATINQQRLEAVGLPGKYICDDGQNVCAHIAQQSQDLLFSCPPYFDLEVYSDDPADASNQDSYEQFLLIIRTALHGAVTCLKENRFAVIVVGDVRDKKSGSYLGLPGDIVGIMKDAGLHVYNECILIEMIGNAPIRAAAQMKFRKVVKTHQQVLVFYKGDPRQVQNHFPEIVYESTDMEALDLGAED